MKASIKLFTSDGLTSRGYPVKLIVVHNGKRARRTISYSYPDQWDELKQVPRPAHPDFELLYGRILEIKRMAVTHRFLALEDTRRAMDLLLGNKPVVESITLLEYFDIEIERLRKSGRYGTADKYNITKSQIQQYDRSAVLQKLDVGWVEAFKRYKSPFCANSTLKTHLSVLRALYNKALVDPSVEISDTGAFNNVMKGVKVRRGRTKQRYLDRETICRIEQVEKEGNLPATELRALRLGLLQFYLGGASLKDVYYLKHSQFFGDRVMMQRAKLGNMAFEYDLKVFEKTTKILNSLKGKDRRYLFDFPKEHRAYKIFRTNNNRSLRSLQERLGIKLSPLDTYLNGYTFRHTFATLGKFAFVDTDILRELMGHERGDIDVVYKDRYPQEVRDNAHGLIIGMD